MKKAIWRITTLAVALLAVSWAIVITTARGAGLPYTGIDLGTFGGSFGVARAITNSGVVVGDASLAGPYRHAFRWEHGVKTDLGTLGGSFSTATGINERGQVVGGSTVEEYMSQHACLWDSGRIIDLNPEGAPTSTATAINGSGVIAGYYQTPDYRTHACIWRHGAMLDLGLLSNSYSVALAINDAGRVAGYYQPELGTTCAFVWDNGSVTDVGGCAQNSYAVANGINNRDLVVATQGNGMLPFLWNRGAITPLSIWPNGINNAGMVAGAYLVGNNRYNAALWRDGTVIDLGTALGFGGSAAAVNERSEAVGFAWTDGTMYSGQHPFLLGTGQIDTARRRGRTARFRTPRLRRPRAACVH
jgi:probable HAF family extracellular repeat protein